MPRLFLPKEDLKRIIRQRRRRGADRYDEVWNGTYVMSPLADNQHQQLATGLSAAFLAATEGRPGTIVLAGTNVSDRVDQWTRNYRCAEVAVFLPGNPAQDRGSHWLGGPDLTVEVLSPGDRSRRKFAFYVRVGVQEVLLVDRNPWRLELHRNEGGELILSETSTPDSATVIASDLLPVTLRLVAAEPRPRILVSHEDGRAWTI
ncbi:MAG: Uma2 family endonuclease [Isosphaeraceae bacterium]